MSTPTPRVPLYDRLPEIYRIRDEEESPPGQLRALLAAVETAFGAVHESIEGLHDDLFIDTCDDWVIPYLADLLGTSHLRGLPWTLRADVADTIALRRRKGTRAAIERLAANLTRWPCRAVELFPSLAWNQHLNHQRPDAGGAPPYGRATLTRFDVPRGGTAPIRDPAMLSLLGTPFDTFAYSADVKPADDGALHVNLPNLAIFLWRLAAYRIPVARPLAKGAVDLGPPPAGSGRARFAVRFDLDPLDRPVRLFNTHRPRLTVLGSESLTGLDAVPCPVPAARLTSGSAAGNPDAYVTVDVADTAAVPPTGLDVSDVGLQLYVPEATFAGTAWTFRGDNLCGWEAGLRRPLGEHEIVIDPDIGRVVFGVAVAAERDALADALVGYTYGAVGPIAAHPVSRRPLPPPFDGPLAVTRTVSALAGTTLQNALANLDVATVPVIVEIRDSLTYDLDPSTLPGALTENGLTAIQLAQPLLIRAANGHRPVIRLAAPLAFRPVDPADPAVPGLAVRLEGLFISRNAALAAANGLLVARAAVARLEMVGCTLDPGGFRQRDGTRAPVIPSLRLANDYGFAAAADLDAFEPTPEVILDQTVAGALLIDDGYRLVVESSLIDAGKGVGEVPSNTFAVGPASAPPDGWGPPLDVRGATFFGRVRVARVGGSGGVFVHKLEAWDHQHGCLKQCYFSGAGDRLPPNHACVSGPDARLGFTSSWFGDPGYGQLGLASDVRVRTRGPDDEPMGACGFLREASRWDNLNVRLREFMPVGVRPLVLPVT